MAAFYHFGRYWLPEYERTNVQGLQNILEGAMGAGAGRFIFAGSVASLPAAAGGILTERSLPGTFGPCPKSKTIGEKRLSRYSPQMPTVVLRIGGVFSDWCELPPLYSLMKLWGRPAFPGRMSFSLLFERHTENAFPHPPSSSRRRRQNAFCLSKTASR